MQRIGEKINIREWIYVLWIYNLKMFFFSKYPILPPFLACGTNDRIWTRSFFFFLAKFGRGKNVTNEGEKIRI